MISLANFSTQEILDEYINRILKDRFPIIANIINESDPVRKSYKIRLVQQALEIIDKMDTTEVNNQQDEFIIDMINDAIVETGNAPDVEITSEETTSVPYDYKISDFHSCESISLHTLNIGDISIRDRTVKVELLDVEDIRPVVIKVDYEHCIEDLWRLADNIATGRTVTQQQAIQVLHERWKSVHFAPSEN